MKAVRIVLITLLSLVIVSVLVWCVVHYLVWPKPELVGLVPNTPLFLVATSDLGVTLSDVGGSEFANRVARSPLWRDVKSSSLWQQVKLQKRIWERQMGASIDPEGIIQLVEKDAILAVYGKQMKGFALNPSGNEGTSALARPWSFLLISEVGVATRLNITSRSTRRMLASMHKFTTENYRGVELMTLAGPGWEFSYGFIGRAGLLSIDKALLKEVVNLYREGRQGLAETPELRESISGLPGPDISFYVDSANIRGAFDLSHTSPFQAYNVKIDPRLRYLTYQLLQHIDVWTGAGFRQHGNLRLDIQARHVVPLPYKRDESLTREVLNVAEVVADDRLAVPANCLFFMLYGKLNPGLLFQMLRAIVGSDFDFVRDKLLPVLHTGAAVAVLEPNVKELQLLPPVISFFWLKDKTAAQAALEGLKGSLKIRGRQLEFAEVKHEGTAINYARLPIGMGMSIDAGYALIGDDLLVVATDTSALEAAIDVALGKRQSLMESEQYAEVLSSIVGAGLKPAPTGGRVFLDIRSIATMTKQAARLYAWRAKLAGEREAERIATMLYQNVSTLEAWHYMGLTFNSDDGRTDVKLTLDSDQ